MHRLDRIRGSLVGGAVGDALGYPVEFLNEAEIFRTYGMDGIVDYELNRISGLAAISDDTQMTLFTANALLFGMHRQNARGISGEPRHYALQAYLGWLHTQQVRYSEENRIPDDPTGWASFLLRDVPELYVPRAPGTTCITGLMRRQSQLDQAMPVRDFIADPINDSKGCGGIMRVAPLGLSVSFLDMPRLDLEGAQIAAITHSHPLGYMPAAVLTHILNRLVNCDSQPDLKAITLEARDCVAALFDQEPYTEELIRIIDLAICLSENDRPDLENIRRLGQGWVAEEALAIPLYCSLKYRKDFSKAVTVSVNHSGDSDSTGAITGNIMGALLGYSSIEPRWTEKLELHDLILKMADELHSAFYL